MARLPGLFSPSGLLGVGDSDPFLVLHREMNRLFNDVLRGSLVPAGSQGSSQEGMLVPHMDVSESDKELRIHTELPGVREQDVELSLNRDVLSIRAEKRQQHQEDRQGMHVSERTFGTFQRSLRLPSPINPDQVQARFENGVLTITIPKAQQQERSRRIQVQGAQGQAGTGQDQASQGGESTQGGQKTGQ